MNYWTIELMNYWTIELLNYWTIEPLNYWTIELFYSAWEREREEKETDNRAEKYRKEKNERSDK